jgi:hypothetical protein
MARAEAAALRRAPRRITLVFRGFDGCRRFATADVCGGRRVAGGGQTGAWGLRQLLFQRFPLPHLPTCTTARTCRCTATLTRVSSTTCFVTCCDPLLRSSFSKLVWH